MTGKLPKVIEMLLSFFDDATMGIVLETRNRFETGITLLDFTWVSTARHIASMCPGNDCPNELDLGAEAFLTDQTRRERRKFAVIPSNPFLLTLMAAVIPARVSTNKPIKVILDVLGTISSP